MTFLTGPRAPGHWGVLYEHRKERASTLQFYFVRTLDRSSISSLLIQRSAGANRSR